MNLFYRNVVMMQESPLLDNNLQANSMSSMFKGVKSPLCDCLEKIPYCTLYSIRV